MGEMRRMVSGGRGLREWRAWCRPGRPVEKPVPVCPTGCYWFEGHPVRNWTIVGNSFIGCNYATAATVSGRSWVKNASDPQ